MNDLKIGIIGGKGAMGRWFQTYFKQDGYPVFISDLDTRLSNAELAVRCDMVILSIPVQTAVSVADEIGPLMKKHQLLLDICSLKEKIVEAMLRSTEAEVIGAHPMFGPFTDDIHGQNVILCPARCHQWKHRLEKMFQTRGANICYMQPAVHDKHMAVAQGLTHFLNVCMGKTLQLLNIVPEEAMHYSTPIFRLNLDLIGRLFAQDLDLYATLIGDNPYVNEVLQIFMEAMYQSQEHMLGGGKEKKIEFMEEIQSFLGDFCQKGLKESSYALEALWTTTENNRS
jgi:prephenate dehydrogenase